MDENEFKIVGLIEGLKIDNLVAADIKQNLLKEIDDSNLPLKFESFLWIVEGWVEINCTDKFTSDWLLNESDFTISFNKINKYKIKFYPVGEYIPITIAVLNYGQKFETLKSRLEQQNPNLNTRNWRLVKEKTYTNANKTSIKKFLFEADGETIKYLEKNSWQLYLQFGLVKVRKFDDTVYRCDSKKELCSLSFSLCEINSFFNREDLKGKYFLSHIYNEILLARWHVKPLGYTSKVLSP